MGSVDAESPADSNDLDRMVQIQPSRATQGYTSPHPMIRTQHQDPALLYANDGQYRPGGKYTQPEEDPTTQYTFGHAAILKKEPNAGCYGLGIQGSSDCRADGWAMRRRSSADVDENVSWEDLVTSQEINYGHDRNRSGNNTDNSRCEQMISRKRTTHMAETPASLTISWTEMRYLTAYQTVHAYSIPQRSSNRKRVSTSLKT